MTKQEAAGQLKIGYFLFITGTVLGLLIFKKLNQGAILGALLLGYLFWSTYWGYIIMHSYLDEFFNVPIYIEASNGFDYFQKVLYYKYTLGLIKLVIYCIVGALGGGIYKQIQLSKIAYFDE